MLSFVSLFQIFGEAFNLIKAFMVAAATAWEDKNHENMSRKQTKTE